MIAALHSRLIEIAINNRLRRKPTTQHSERDSLGSHWIGKPRGITHKDGSVLHKLTG